MDDTISKKAKICTNLYDLNESKIIFSQSYEPEKYKLIEAPIELLESAYKGESLFIKGSENALDAILCSENKTYNIKKVETSNSVFLVPPSASFKFEINSKSTEYYELKLCEPKVDDLNILLSKSEYKGMDEEKENPPNKADLYTRDDLNSCILMSQNELDAALSDIGAIEVKGYLRICSENVKHNLNKALINTIIENDWPLNNIKLNDCLNELPDVDETLLKRSLSYLGSQIDLDDPTWNLNPSLLSSAAAHILFRENPPKKVYPASDFMDTWVTRVPGKDSPSEELLQGIAIQDEDGKNFIYCPVSELSKDPQARFQQLFAIKKKLKLEEIKPYIYDLINKPGNPKEDELLLKYTREIDGYFISKM